MISRQPISFRPYLKQVVWGGDKICTYKGISRPFPKIGESWEISAIPGFESVVDGGEYAGLSITELVNRFGEELLGTEVVRRYGMQFPLLFKFIEAADNVSVQVHPDDAIARERHGCQGKTELWYIISTDNNASIVNGFNRELTPDEYFKKVADGSFGDTLAVHPTSPGDVYFIPAGRVHAIGKGNLMAEIQQSSDITYRIYDYDRNDINGRKRELHTELAREALDYKVYDNYKLPTPSVDRQAAEIGRCEHFVTVRRIINGNDVILGNRKSFTVLMCVEGEMTMTVDRKSTAFHQGQTVLIPAVTERTEINGKGILLEIRC